MDKKSSSASLFQLSAVAWAILATLSLPGSAAGSLDDESQPPPTDPSAYVDAPEHPDETLHEMESWPKANKGAYDLPNGVSGDKNTPTAENVLQPLQQTSFNYPTNGTASPLFGAQPFTQQVLRFEEFGLERLDPGAPAGTLPLPPPSLGPAPAQDPLSVARSGPPSSALDDFLRQPGLFPFPAQYSNVLDPNPWKSQIEHFLNRYVSSPAEGRPPGKGWSHQRWNEFYPQAAFKTVQAGARVNGGVRNGRQLHGYAVGEFGPGGLYHNTAGTPATAGTTAGIGIRLHPNMPVQNHKSLWTFDGTLPPKLLMVRYGQPMLMRHYNALPIDPAANRGFGLHTISTHEHNGHVPAESDGFANAFFFPGQYYDYRWPVQLAGYDSINTRAEDPRAAFPCAPGETLWVNDLNPGPRTCGDDGKIRIRGDWRETMSTHWFHDHMLDFTAQNVYKGNAAVMNYYSAVDRGNEAFDDGVNLRFPSGSALPWGNRDYDVNLVMADKAWDDRGQLWFNPFNTDGFLGDQMVVNWLYKPYMEVRARSYRFRLLNGSVSRYFKIAVVREIQGSGGEFKGPKGSGVSYDRVPFHMIANDGNIMEHAVPFDGSMDLDGDGDRKDHHGILPTQAIAERYDIIIDFARHGIRPGDRLYLVNLMEHDTGKGPSNKELSLGEVLSEAYKATLDQTSKGARWRDGDPVVGKFLQLRVVTYGGNDLSMNPAEYEPAKPGKAAGKKMIPLTIDRNSVADRAKLAQARKRHFTFGRSDGTDAEPWTVKTDGGLGYAADPRRISAAPQLANGPTDAGWSGDGTLEVWTIENGGGGWSHPVHVHFEEGVILSRDGREPPEWEKWARKDVYRVGPEVDGSIEVEVALRFREFAGTYVEHCHNTQHEDTAMLLRWDLEHPGQFQFMPTPLPTWDGVQYAGSVALPTARSSSGGSGSSGGGTGGSGGGTGGSAGGTGGDGGSGGGTPPANQLPVAMADSASTRAGAAISIDVLANDSDPEGQPLSIVDLNPPFHGQGSASTDGDRVLYTPPTTLSEPLTATFTYSARDAQGGVSSPATISVTVNPAPSAEDLKVTTAEVRSRSGNRYRWELSGRTSLPSGNSIEVTVATRSGPLSLGKATLTSAGSWRLSVETTGSGPAAAPTATIRSIHGEVTVPLKAL
ncbi:copper oxidase [Pseudomonas sp. A-1]|uniref:Ig-like domain-containing protein n=1 Tax=Pseudomonas sp. A-1 TaxID=1821274 RepID=UPI0010A677B4|nr:Ig-like domain-containing protein [Pseudomonas sp. A-1]THG86124.1 copper oxidase [Pseudomonas sp. A-1]